MSWLGLAADDPFGVHNLPYGAFVIAATAPGPGGARLPLGEVRGRIVTR